MKQTPAITLGITPHVTPPVHLLRDMALFVEVAHQRSFTRAAARLEMPTSTLSRRITGLERALGLPLLRRTTRRVDLTEAGSDYLDRCAHLVEAARAVHEQVGRAADEAVGVLRVSCTPDFATFYLPPVLEAYTRAHPNVSVELDLSPRVVDLHGEALDAAIRIGPLADSTLVARPLGSLHRGVYASPAYLRVAGVPQNPIDLERHMVVQLRAGDEARRWRFTAQRDSGTREADAAEPIMVEVQGRFVAGSVSMVRELVLRGAGVGQLDDRIAAADVAAGRLRRLLPGWALPPSPIHLLTVSRHGPARVRLFAQALAVSLR